MKTVFILILTTMSLLLPAQCQITGASTVKVGDSLQLMSNTAAKCIDCYRWNVSSDELLHIQSSAEGKIILKALKAGTINVNLTVETADGKFTCEKNVEIQNPSPVKEKQCDIEISDFKDVKVDDSTMSFFPDKISQKYFYYWQATYSDGSIKESEEKIPQFPNSPSAIINTVLVKIINKSSNCFSVITRTYDEKFWFPKVEKVEQRKYIQGSYQQIQSKTRQF
ncbi:hypothetical protein ASG31_13560 [Chryseobacterium sp. Leaf404]|uniref:hypothetical protein n=1 Tax=unclassified Chryseobacterium TaxID=2593645 RepID=UPI0006F93EEC|nr:MULTISPECIES: hypothetical protein [unclassified Chryseobacterium]KQT16000.1 hypothetical protein ASG31_13560 [Chryseobacterium sp. Leaf404]